MSRGQVLVSLALAKRRNELNKKGSNSTNPKACDETLVAVKCSKTEEKQKLDDDAKKNNG